MANKILVARGTKARLEEIKSTLAANELVYSTDTGELGVKKANGDIEYFKNAADIDDRIDTLDTSKQDKLVAGNNITIDGNNVISATGDIGGTVDWQDVENKPELQDKLIAGEHITIENNVISALSGTANNTIELGNSANTEGSAAIAIGSYASALEDFAVAIGSSVTASGVGSIAMGEGAFASGDNSIAIGAYTEVTEENVADFGSDRQVRVNLIPVNDRDAVSKNYLENVNSSKQDKLVAGENITINENNVISASGGPIVDLGTFNDQTELITYAVMNQLPTGYYTFIMEDWSFFMLLRKFPTYYIGTFYAGDASYFYFNVSIYGEIIELETIRLRDLVDLGELENLMTDFIDYVNSQDALKADTTYVDGRINNAENDITQVDGRVDDLEVAVGNIDAILDSILGV